MRNTARIPLWLLGVSCSLCALAWSGESSAEELRPLSTDRPDVTESPYSVDPGHFQLEADVFRKTKDEGVTSYSVMTTNLKVGVLSFMDLQLVVESLNGTKIRRKVEWEFGDLTLRSKLNLYGNDGGDIAIAVMPWGKYPTAKSGNGKIDGGLIGLLGISLPWDFSTGFMVEADWVGNEVGPKHHFELLTTATVGHPIWDPLGAYVEIVGLQSKEPGVAYALSTDGGFTFGVSERIQLDAGIALGLNDAAEDLSFFGGASFKL